MFSYRGGFKNIYWADWLNEYKNKTHICAVYKSPTSDLRTDTDKVRGWKQVLHTNGNHRKGGVAILTNRF